MFPHPPLPSQPPESQYNCSNEKFFVNSLGCEMPLKPSPMRLDGALMCISISILLFTLSIIPTHCDDDRELSRAESRRILALITKALQSPTQGCPELLFSTGTGDVSDLAQSNHSHLFAFRPKYAEFLRTVITPATLYSSYRRDIVRAVSMAELVINWISIKGLRLAESTVGNVDMDNFLKPLMRAFMQTSSYYQRSTKEGDRVGESVINSIAICVGTESLIYVEKASSNPGDGAFVSQPPSNLCELMTPILEASHLISISTTLQMLGVWAPLHCNPSIIKAGKKIPLHLIVPIPHTKSVSMVFEFDLRNFTLDLCAAGLDYCRHSTTQCVYRQYQAWPFDISNYICQCKPGFYTDWPDNGYPAELYLQEKERSSSSGGTETEGRKSSKSGWERMSCKVCPPDCPNCTSSEPCLVEYNMHLRGIPLAVQTFSITTTLLLGVLTFRLRRTRVFKAASWLFLEIFLLGAVLLYTTNIVMYFRASCSTCILLPWFREIGFSLMYGVLIVKLYRVLIYFKSRKAHRVHVRDKDLFKYLGWFVAIVIGYMLAWTAVTLDYTRFRNLPGVPSTLSPTTVATLVKPQQFTLPDLLVKGRIPANDASSTPAPLDSSTLASNVSTDPDCADCSFNTNVSSNFTAIRREDKISSSAESTQSGMDHNQQQLTKRKDSQRDSTTGGHYRYFRVCRALFWDIVVELGEMSILLIGVHYCRLIWSAPSDYNENRCIAIAFLTELIGSGTLYLTRHFIWYSMHPDFIYLIYFIRCHLTVTTNITVIFGPKFWYIHKPPTPQQTGGMVVGVGGARRGMVGAVPGASAAPHLVPSNNKLHLASNGELDLADVNLADMDPEVIRRELKRLYTAIEIYKTKAMRRDNPHISKRRGGRKQRRFSLQPFHKKHNGSGGVTGDSASGYQGDVSTASNIGGGALKRTGASGGGGRGGTLLRSSMADEEEASRFSEGSLTSLEKDPVSEIGPRSSNRSKNQQSTSSHHEYPRHRQETG
ncbi:hypothetical protein Aperf_G00000071292 [Anoplocephala perfoliata]